MLSIQALRASWLGERLIRRNPLYYPAAVGRFERLSTATLEERRSFLAGRVRVVLACAANTPYGRRLGRPQRLEDWPLLDRNTVRDEPASLTGPAHWMTSRASTGGTSGVPLRLRRSPASVAVEQAALDRVLSTAGVDPLRARVAVLRGDIIKDVADLTPPFWRLGLGGRRLALSSNHLCPGTAEAFAQALEGFCADYWWAYPTTLELLCRALQAGGRKLHVPLVVTSSEIFRPDAWHAIERQLDCRIIDYYGQAERVAFAVAMRPNEYWVLPGYAAVELIPRSSEGADELFEVVGTSLWNLSMPLVRYRTGDLLRLPAGTSPAAREAMTLGVQPLPAVLGRDDDGLVSPEGAWLTGLSFVAREVERVERVQLVQESPNRVVIRVLALPGFAEADGARLLRNLRARVPSTMQLSVEVVDELERTALGKTPHVIRRRGVPDPGLAGRHAP